MGRQLEHARGAALDRAAVAAVSKVGSLAPPWAVLVVVWPPAWIAHALWGEAPAVAWVAMAGTLLSVILAALSWTVSHSRGTLGRAHATLTAGGGTLWITIAVITGPANLFTLGVWFFGGGALAVSWNIRAVNRAKQPDAADQDPLGSVFDKAKERFGLKGATVVTKEMDGQRVAGTLQLPPGEKTQSEMLKKAEALESGMRFPPGSVILAPDEDDASRMHITVTDPRVMRRPIPWPGPSKPGASIADPLRIGVYQDGTEALLTLPGVHLQIMGMTGSGKSIGGAWNILGEAVTRDDVAVFVVDLAKSEQTVGPLLGSLARFISTKSDLVTFIRELVAVIPQRTDYLAKRGLQKWKPGCGLTYQIVYIEEAAKVFDELSTGDEERLLQALKEARSAGVTIILSLQRASYDQMPTTARAQLSKMCFGVADAGDSGFGLSDRQQSADCAPELWAQHQPGMCYLDAPGVPDTHYAMPLRTYAWGEADETASAAMRDHSGRYPAGRVALDEWTRRLVGDAQSPSEGRARQGDESGRDELGDAGDAIADYLSEPETDPEMLRITGNERIEDLTEDEADRFVIPEIEGKASPAEARDMLVGLVRWLHRRGVDVLRPGGEEMLRVRQAAGMSRGWAYKVLRELTDVGALEEDRSGGAIVYRIVDVDALEAGSEPVAV